MEYIKVNASNIDDEHICCAISSNNDIQVSSKKEWMKQCFEDGLSFIKSTERGKCFIETIPAENAWIPLKGDNYLYIDCLWVSGSFKGHGYANDLLNAVIEEAISNHKDGLCILSSQKKKPFLSDPKFLQHKGFKVVDTSDCGIQLTALKLVEQAQYPSFKECAKHPRIDEKGFVLFYTHQCPFNAKYVPILKDTAEKNHIPFKTIYISSKEEAQNLPSPCSTYVLFYDGEFITNEELSDKRLLKLYETLNKPE